MLDAADSTVQTYSILFSDITRFSTLNPCQQKKYLKYVLPEIYDVLYKKKDTSLVGTNMWGDGLVAYFTSKSSALECALQLRDLFRNTNWAKLGLPDLEIRVALHEGEVFVGYNPVRNAPEIIGTEINRAARIEPVVTANHVFASVDFKNSYDRNIYNDNSIEFVSLGKFNLPKDFGQEELFVVLRREYETIDKSSIIKKSKGSGLLLTDQSIPFKERLQISQGAKTHIADYCIKSNFWKADDVVFIESGTLPIFMLKSLYSSDKPGTHPKLFITNNLGCCGLKLIYDNTPSGENCLAPLELTEKCIVTGGRILSAYSATIPEDFTVSQKDPFRQSKEIIECFKKKKLNHIIMMVTRITTAEGPCANSDEMRRFKKLLLYYTDKNPDIRLSILAEAEKLVSRPGQPADKINLPGFQNESYWKKVLKSGRVTVISALSKGMTNKEINYAKQEIANLQNSGASCVLLDSDGVQVTVT